MKKFDYTYALLQNGVLTNSDGTKIKRNSNGGIEIFDNSWDQYLEDAIVPEITYTATNVTSVDKTVKAWTFYCDSLSGCDWSSPNYRQGNGSKENPWRSMTYALVQIENLLTCWRNSQCYCFRKGRYFQLKVKGTIDYMVNYLGYDPIQYNVYNYLHGGEYVNNEWVRQFIISPWGESSWTAGDIRYIYGTILNRMNIRRIGINRPYFHQGSSSIFNHVCFTDAGFEYCDNAKFIDLTATYSEYHQDEHIMFYSCNGSDIIGFTVNNVMLNGGSGMNIYNAIVTINNNSDEYYKIINGITGFSSCGFYNCRANVSGTLNCEIWKSSQGNKYFGYVDACGFYGNRDSTFFNCTTTNQCKKCADEWHECRTPDF